MHLCEPCRSERDWENDASLLYQIKENRARKNDDPAKARCKECTHPGTGEPTFIRNPLFEICRRCAERLRECQHCRTSTLQPKELAAQEAFDTLFDAYVTLVKTFGVRSARALLGEAALSPDEAPHAPTLIALDVGLVDSAQPHQKYYERLRRPIWTRVWGTLTFNVRPPRCTDCPPPSRYAPSMVRASGCGHWTAGTHAVWCLPCAVEQRVCSVCETSTE